MLSPIEPGTRIGTYRVIGPYPHGGHRALDVTDATRIHLDVGPAVDWRDRAIQLLRASSIVASLDHPGIARIHGRGVLPDRRPWVASELADGIPLCDILAGRLLTIVETVTLVRDLAEIVAHAHARRIVHGAIRPHLVVMRTGDQPFPLQLGGWGEVSLARDAADGRADVHAIGAIAYRAVTGSYPAMVPPDLVAGVPGPVGALLAGMLARRITALQALATASRLATDRALAGPRFVRPRWTPVPLPDGERVADIYDFVAARADRS